jgi:hypothetical protein
VPKYEKIVVVDSQVEAGILEGVLREHGIPHLIKSYHDSAYDGLFQAQKGWGHVAAPAEYKDEIKALYKGVQERNIVETGDIDLHNKSVDDDESDEGPTFV